MELGEPEKPAEAGKFDEQCDRAMELKNQGRYDEALDEFQRILGRKADHAPAHLGLGLVLCFVGRFDESLEELRQAVACAPEWVEAHLNLGKTYAMLGMYDEAKMEFNRVLELRPGHPEARKQLSYFQDMGE